MTDPLIYRARDLARVVHSGQLDQAGEPYIGHPERVVAYLTASPEWAALPEAEQTTALCAAWLHDVIEDAAGYWIENALENMFPDDVTQAVTDLTREHDIPAEEYYATIADNSVSLAVKLADLADNTNADRLCLLDVATHQRLVNKYIRAYRALGRDDKADALVAEYTAAEKNSTPL